MHSIESKACYRSGKLSACRPLCAFFHPENLQVGAVEWLKEERSLVKGSFTQKWQGKGFRKIGIK